MDFSLAGYRESDQGEVHPRLLRVNREGDHRRFGSGAPGFRRDLRIENDFVFALTGYHPDIDFLGRAGVEVDAESYRPACNPQTLESNVPGLYVAGVVVSGRQTNEIFIENGRFHGKQIIADVVEKRVVGRRYTE